MADVTQSFSQLIYTYGPGAMLDLPDHAVLVAGLEDWHASPPASQVINEPRLTELLRSQLPDRIPHNVVLRTPPRHEDRSYSNLAPGIAVRIFPTWFVCDPVDGHPSGGAPGETSRRMVEWTNLDVKKNAMKAEVEGKMVPVSPVRFVAACSKGHLQDIEWRFIVHRDGGDRACKRPMWWVERGVSSDPGDLSVRCDCGRRVTLADLYKPKFLGSCNGRTPWLDRFAQEVCDQDQRLLSRSATNTYFAQSVRVISLPLTDDAITRAVDADWPAIDAFLKAGMPAQTVIGILKVNPATSERFKPFADADIERAIGRHGEVIGSIAAADPRVVEFEAIIGSDAPGSLLHAQTLPRAALGLSGRLDELIKNVVAVHRLREVTCLYGFTRLEPAPTASESELDEIRLAVEGARLSQGAAWLPAIEQFGEGIFLHLDSGEIDRWRARTAVATHARCLGAGEDADASHRKRQALHPGVAWWTIHSLSHALMIELSLECGYPLSSLKERIYASAKPPHRFGLLLYTATAGGQGTLGGLCAMAVRMPMLIERAVERLSLCSNDPVCSDHRPDDEHDDSHLHGAACHGCLLIPETSCEARNGRLDRALLAPTLRQADVALFGS